MAEGMTRSSKTFHIFENDLPIDVIEKFKKVGARVKDERVKTPYNKLRKGKDEDGYNPFALADAVGKGSSKEAWIEYSRARIMGVGPEELHARVWGKVRDMLSSQGAGPIELGIHPFVYKKAKADFKNWKGATLRNFSDELLSIYHDSRLGGEELRGALEKLILNIET